MKELTPPIWVQDGVITEGRDTRRKEMLPRALPQLKLAIAFSIKGGRHAQEDLFAAARYDPRRCIKEVQSYLRIK
jgi:hypothetical protein